MLRRQRNADTSTSRNAINADSKEHPSPRPRQVLIRGREACNCLWDMIMDLAPYAKPCLCLRLTLSLTRVKQFLPSRLPLVWFCRPRSDRRHLLVVMNKLSICLSSNLFIALLLQNLTMINIKKSVVVWECEIYAWSKSSPARLGWHRLAVIALTADWHSGSSCHSDRNKRGVRVTRNQNKHCQKKSFENDTIRSVTNIVVLIENEHFL